MESYSFRDLGGTMKTVKTRKLGLVNANNKSFNNSDLLATRVVREGSNFTGASAPAPAPESGAEREPKFLGGEPGREPTF